MFQLSVVDHVRLNFGHVVQNYTVHAEAASRLGAVAAKARMLVLTLFALATASSITNLVVPSRSMQIATAAAVGVAFVGYALYVALGLETRVYAHRSCAHRLWMMCERYRSLLAEAQDGLLDRESVLRRRDVLLEALHSVYEQAFPADQQAFESLRQLPQGDGKAGLTDAEIDQFLPESLRVRALTNSAAQ
jgi:hypothetical protein